MNEPAPLLKLEPLDGSAAATDPIVDLAAIEKQFGAAVVEIARRSIQLGITIGERCVMHGVELASMMIDQGAFTRANQQTTPPPTPTDR